MTMQFGLTWLEVTIRSGAVVIALGPERLLEVCDDSRKLGVDLRSPFRRKKT